MKKIMNWMLAAILVCGASVFTSCNSKDNPITPTVNSGKCTRAMIQYWLSSPKTNYTFFEGKYAIWSGANKQEPVALMSFADEVNGFYPANDISSFPYEEAFFLHYGVKDLESYEGISQLNWNLKYVVTTYNALGDVLDTKEISDEYNEKGQVSSKAELEMTSKLSYIEMHASIAEDGTITLNKAKMHPEDSGIEW